MFCHNCFFEHLPICSSDLGKIARDREEIHKNHKSSRPLSHNYEYIGLKAESCFADKYGLAMDKELKPSGDNGKDFIINNKTIDIKAARKAYNLIVEKGKVKSDIYVLAQYCDVTDNIDFLGWAAKPRVLNAPGTWVGI